ncbi:hypothetical protein K5F81_15725 [Acinetobacter baumannii]|uniref:hypothetical protein n=1 Tax=Acinetobacter baumannii TaxID=470 RepID=UPI001FF29C54|nr:hypothetical protein [Acinetobacter baumannii]MCJ9514500.1 hypothetical protein [Acinetobacter baumannii]
MPFSELMTDIVSIYDEDGNLIREGVKSLVQGGKAVHTLGADFPLEIGYFVERATRTGVVERYKVLEPNYYGDFHGIPAHYQMKVVNVKAIPDPRNASTINHIEASGNARVYQHSIDNSINTYTTKEFKDILNKIKSDILDLELDNIEQALTTKAITKITEEVEKGQPNKDKLGAYISLLPTAVATLESVLNLASMAGIT